jgi:hypothetical protein
MMYVLGATSWHVGAERSVFDGELAPAFVHVHRTSEEVATMGLLDKLFGRTKAAPPPPTPIGPCRHVTLVPTWGSVADMGEEDRVTGYTCQGCQQTFIAAEGRALRQAEAERLPKKIAV